MQSLLTVLFYCFALSPWTPATGLASKTKVNAVHQEIAHHEKQESQDLRAEQLDSVVGDEEDDTEAEEPDNHNTQGSNSETAPKLPPVSAMLGDATATAKSINEQAAMLEARILRAQREDQEKMTKRKASLEHKLKVQEEGTEQLNATINEMAAVNDRLDDGNKAIRQRAKEVRDGNRLMVSELRALDVKLAAARTFVSDSLKSIDDSHDKTLDVLNEKENAKELEEEDSQEKDKPDSFLAVGHRLVRTSVEDIMPPLEQDQDVGSLVDVLAKGVTSMSKQQKDSEKKLEDMFVESYKAGTQKRADLLADQKDEEEDRTALTMLQGQLRTALEHLEATHDQSQEKLRALGLFLQRLGHMALSPEKEVQNLMETLPSVPQEKKPKSI